MTRKYKFNDNFPVSSIRIKEEKHKYHISSHSLAKEFAYIVLKIDQCDESGTDIQNEPFNLEETS